MTTAAEPDPVVDDRHHHRLVVGEGAGAAELVYRVNGTRLVLVHTEVPEPLRSRGIAGRLVHTAVEWASAEGLTVVPVCPYARYWLEHHPEAASSVAVDWGADR